MDLSLSQNFFNLDTYFFKTESFENLRKEILNEKFRTLRHRDWIFFLANVSKYKASH